MWMCCNCKTSASSNKSAGSNGLGKRKGGKRKYTPAATQRVIRWNIMMETSVDADADDDDDDRTTADCIIWRKKTNKMQQLDVYY